MAELKGPSAEFLNAFEALSLAVNKIIQYNNIKSRVQEFHTGVRADIAGTAGYQDSHSRHTFLRACIAGGFRGAERNPRGGNF
jgi:hypothetical protein